MAVVYQDLGNLLLPGKCAVIVDHSHGRFRRTAIVQLQISFQRTNTQYTIELYDGLFLSHRINLSFDMMSVNEFFNFDTGYYKTFVQHPFGKSYRTSYGNIAGFYDLILITMIRLAQ